MPKKWKPQASNAPKPEIWDLADRLTVEARVGDGVTFTDHEAITEVRDERGQLRPRIVIYDKPRALAEMRARTPHTEPRDLEALLRKYARGRILE